jgi:hypothetical protein
VNKKISKTISRSIGVVCFGVFLNIYFIIPVHAYIDPATTAMLTQIVAGIFISIGVAFGIFRKRIFLFFKNIGIKRLQRKIEKQNRKNKAL